MPTAVDAALHNALGQFLDEQRNAVGASGDLVDDLVRQRGAARDLLDQGGPVTPVQPVERQHCHLGLTGPRRLELWPEGHDQQHRQAADTLDGQVEQFARSRVNPMRVLEKHQHRLLARQTL